MSTTTSQYLEWHHESLHEDNIFKCELCDFTAQCKDKIMLHSKASHEEQNELIGCENEMNNKTVPNIVINESGIEQYKSIFERIGILKVEEDNDQSNVEYFDMYEDCENEDGTFYVKSEDWTEEICESNLQLKSVITIKDENLNFKQESIMKSEYQSSLIGDIEDGFLIKKNKFNENDLIKRDHTFDDNIEYDDVLIDNSIRCVPVIPNGNDYTSEN